MNLFARFFLVLLIAAAAARGADDYQPGPDSKPQEGVPKGEVMKFTFAGSRIFPGTTREVSVYVPKQYDPAKPACVYVNQDGVQNNAPVVFDNLIARGEIPVTIGIFITPGRVKAPNENALDRFDRSYEYDGLGDAYAKFLLDEILPEVERKTAADGRAIHLSKNGNDRAIGGSSSGAIAAFTAAWERPEAFSRVFSSIGTYVGLRGGNVYPTLIRKYEPKPLRVFLQDGSADQNIYGGDWWMANQEMERALTFAGYEVNHVWGDGGHNGKQAAAIFPDAMRWLWKDWPAPIKAGTGSKPLQEILMAGEGWTEEGGEGGRNAESRELPSGFSAKLQNGNRYATDPEAASVWLVNAAGAKRVVDDGIKEPSGVCTSPDQTLLYVADRESHWVWSFQIQADGSLADKQLYYHLHMPDTVDGSGAGGMCVDRDGRLYVATRLGVQVCDQAGRVNCILPVPGGAVEDVRFSGSDFDALVAVVGQRAFHRKVKTRGVDPAAGPIKPAAPHL